MERLKAALPYIEQNKCALFIGAGFSKIAGCYDWDSVVENMLDQIVIRDSGIKKEDLIGDIDNEKLMNYCFNIFKKNGQENKYWGIARDAIIYDPILYHEKYLPIIKLLKLISPLPQMITTNIDNCLENTREFDLSEIYFKPEHFIEEKLNGTGIFHVHGFIEEFEQSLLIREQYITRYKDAQFQDFLASLFNKYMVIFLGYSLRDQEIQDIMQHTKEKDKNHFLLLPDEDNFDSSKMTVFKELYGIETIKYGKQDKFPEIFESWIIKYFKTVAVEDDYTRTPDV